MFRRKKSASAAHILVKSEKQAQELLQMLEKGADFAKLARRFSTCPSNSKGGDLGEFRQGTMVPAFDKAVFEGPMGLCKQPIKTRFGYHLIKVNWRD